ncbi:phage regulatory CII family protein [Desulfohalovibrio reitneri]|uniref:phage regulatory CII family protein n=1 Tax=Desulfohalovibrio reitneri TaxID=1307759 RepID=UPI000555CDC6|nr:phage regulatory CII family protein [Desulfohalovibrio reitneri]
MKDTITSIIHQHLVERHRGKARTIAAKIGKPYPTLMRELNPWDQGAKLGADTFVEILKQTRDADTLAYIAKELGYSISPLEQSDETCISQRG